MTTRILKINDAFESYLNHILRDCNLSYEELIKPSAMIIKNLSILVELTMKELYDYGTIFKSKINYRQAVEDSLKQRFFYNPPEYTLNDLNHIDNIFKILDSHHKHAQRSPEWYKFRWERLTASDLANAIGERGEKSRLGLVYQKAMSVEQYIKQRESSSLTGPAIQHGICFEPVATELYELKNKLTVLEYGCLPHQHINFLAASPDGICSSKETNPNMHGRMLEIKCPYSRVITGIPKLEYYMQVQLQLEVCDLEYCDFLECDIRTYSGMANFLGDSPKGSVSYTLTSSSQPKGVVYEYCQRGATSFKYKYCPMNLKDQEVSDWISNIRTEINSNPHNYNGGYKYWWLEEFNITLIKREREYFNNLKIKLAQFWDLVVYYRNKGVLELEYKLGIKKPPPSYIESILENKLDNNMNYMSFDNFEKFDKKTLDNVDFIDIIDSDDDMSKKSLKDTSLLKKQVGRKGKVDELDFIDISDSEDENNNNKDTSKIIKKVEMKQEIKSEQKLVKKNILVIKPDSDDD